jgi:hypothetical protein
LFIKQTFSARFNVIVEKTGHVWGKQYRSEILAGDPPKAAEIGWGMAEAKAKTKIPAGMTHTLSWDGPREAGMTEKMRFSFKIATASSFSSG